MLRGIDGVHTWTSPDGLTLRINELDDISTGESVWPRYRLLDVDHGYPEAGDTYHKRVGQSGAVIHPDYRGPRVHSYTIEIMGRTINELRQGEETFRQAFADQSAEGRMDVGTHPLNPDYDADNDRYFNAKALSLQAGTDAPDSDLSPQLGFRREYVLGLRNHEGVYYQDLTLAGFKAAIIDLGPSLYWALDADDGATDLSGNGNDGTAQGSATIGASGALTAIVGDSATNLDGTDDGVSSASAVPSGVLTFLGFASRDASASDDCLFASDGGDDYCLLGSGAQTVGVKAALAGGGPQSTGASFSGNGIATLYAVKWDGSRADVSIDGAAFAGISFPYSFGSQKVWLGRRPAGQAPFDGKVAHFAVFDRALSIAEVSSVYEMATTGIRERV